MSSAAPHGDSPPPAGILQALAAATRDLLVLTDRGGRIVWANGAFLGATGWPDPVGRMLPPVLQADDIAATANLQGRVASALGGGALDDTLVRLRVDLPRQPQRLRLRIDNADPMRLWTLTDASADRADPARADALAPPTDPSARAAHDETTARLALAVDLAGVAIWRHDIQTDRIYYNARGFEVLGMAFRPEGLSLDQVRQRIHPDDMPLVIEGAQRTLASAGPVDVQARYRHEDGSWRHVLTRRVVQRDAHDTPIAFLGVGLDLTEQLVGRAAEEAHRLSTATASAGIGVWSRDTVTEEAHWNRQMYRLCGRDPSLGPPSTAAWIDAIVHPDDRARMRQSLQEAMLADGRVVEHEYRVLRPDGELRWLVNLARLEPWNGRPMIFGATLDVTERRQAEAVTRDALAARRLGEARSQLLARVSHELRTPLNAILGFTQLLEIDAAAPAPGDTDAAQRLMQLGHIRQASEHLLTLVNEVLDLSSIEAGLFQPKLEPVPLDELMTEVLGGLGSAAKGGEVEVHTQTDALVVEADRARLAQVLGKLIGHRLPLVPAGGALNLRAVAMGDEVRIGLADNGHALTPAQQLQLFEPFVRLGTGAGHEPDTGLNLALVKALVACMGGRIDVAGSAQDGTRFVLTLTRAQTSAPTSPPIDEQPAPAPANLGKVLYIEDNPINVILVEELIAQRGGLELACEGTGALGVARAQDMRPDLVLIDMQLPDFDGFEVLRRLRAHPATAHTSCIALSANAMPDDVALALAAGFDDYWTKPIRFGRFLEGLDGIFPRPAAP